MKFHVIFMRVASRTSYEADSNFVLVKDVVEVVVTDALVETGVDTKFDFTPRIAITGNNCEVWADSVLNLGLDLRGVRNAECGSNLGPI